MFGFGAAKKAKERLKDEITQKLQLVTNMIKVQVRMTMFEKGKTRQEILQDVFFQLYAFGAFDAVAASYGLVIRSKIGPAVVQTGYMRFLQGYFELSERDADEYLQRGFDALREAPIPSPIAIGGTDGFGIFQGEAPNGLLAHFGIDQSGEVSGESARKFLEFCERDV